MARAASITIGGTGSQGRWLTRAGWLLGAMPVALLLFSGAMKLMRPPEMVKERAVLVLDDILDHGETMAAIKRGLLELGASSVHCAVLVEKRLNTKKPIVADFVGLQIPDRFVFGCGMDAKGYWRNLPEIRAMKE